MNSTLISQEQSGLAESIDHLLCVEFRRSGVHQGVIHPLYQAARSQTQEPLAWGAARALLAAVDEGTIFIATGHVHPVALPQGETDGPLGAVALARALLAVGDSRIVILCEEVVVPVMNAVCNAAGLNVRPVEMLPMPRSVAILPFPVDATEAARMSDSLIQGAGAIVTVEKIGPCAGGGYRTGSGSDVTASLAKVDLLVDRARSSGVLTIGVGDLGNEMGMAAVRQTVMETVRTGKTIASEVATDHLIVAACSNWGAYGVAAAIAALTRSPQALHDGVLETRMLDAACRAGAVDGFSTGPTLEVDGAGVRTHAAFADLLHDVVTISLNTATPERHRIERRAP